MPGHRIRMLATHCRITSPLAFGTKLVCVMSQTKIAHKATTFTLLKHEAKY